MSERISREQRLLCGLLGQEADLGKVIDMAKQHKVIPLLYEELCEKWEGEPLRADRLELVESVSRVTVKQSYRLFFLTRYLVRTLEQAGIPVLVLKGCGVAELYPVPEARKSGDVDLLIQREKMETAVQVLEKNQFFVKKNQHANHHLACRSRDGIDVELHTMLAEPFQDERINEGMERLLSDCFERKEYRKCMGIDMPLLPEAYQALQLLLHMLQHFLRAGFGLKLLCDWVVFWNRETALKILPEFMRLAQDCHVWNFAEAVTVVCKDFLGLRSDLPFGNGYDKKFAADFLCDIFTAEEFGEADKDRMVIVKRNSLGAYLKEFHYQMKMNHPKTSPYVILWPALWVITLAVFLCNNRKLHRGKVKDILRNAGERSRLLRRMDLENEDG